MTRLHLKKPVGWFTCVAACFGLLLWARLLLLTGHPRTAIADPSTHAPTPPAVAEPATNTQATPPQSNAPKASPPAAIPGDTATAPRP